MFLSHRWQMQENILHARTVVSPRSSNKLSLRVKRDLTTQMWQWEKNWNRKIGKQETSVCHPWLENLACLSYLLTFKTQKKNFLQELSHPLFSNMLFSNQWLPYILINIAFMHRWDENKVFHDCVDVITGFTLTILLSWCLKDCLVIKLLCPLSHTYS